MGDKQVFRYDLPNGTYVYKDRTGRFVEAYHYDEAMSSLANANEALEILKREFAETQSQWVSCRQSLNEERAEVEKLKQMVKTMAGNKDFDFSAASEVLESAEYLDQNPDWVSKWGEYVVEKKCKNKDVEPAHGSQKYKFHTFHKILEDQLPYFMKAAIKQLERQSAAFDEMMGVKGEDNKD